MKKILFRKKLIVIFTVLSTISAIFFVNRYISDGFTIAKIINYENTFDNDATSAKDETKALSILDQPFYYLAKGRQAFVFESQDKKYVLKFISFNKYKEPFRRSLLSTFSLCQDYRKNRKINREKNMRSALNSYKLVYENLKKETRLTYIHLKKKPSFYQKITLFDKTNKSFQINLNNHLFIIQKKANKLKPIFKKYLAKNNINEIDTIFSDYIEMVADIIKKGFLNKDSSMKNAGYIDSRIIDMDIITTI